MLLAGLPIFIWAVATQRIELRKRAATAEPTEICWSRVVVFNDAYNWPNSCRGNPGVQGCMDVLVPLTAEEITGYNSWVSAGKPYIPGCGSTPKPTVPPPTPTCQPRPPCLDAIPRCLMPETSDMCPPIDQNSCTGAKDGTSCVDTCARACPPDVKFCTDQCTTRNGVCIGGRCETWITPTITRYPTPSLYPTLTRYPTPTYYVTPTPPQMFTLSVNGAVPELLPNQVMPLTINVQEYDGSAGTPTEGFNAQVAVDVLPLVGTTPSVFSQNAIFNPNTQRWEVTVPRPQNEGTYRLQVHAYCAQDNSLCTTRYGRSRQLSWEYQFKAVIPQPQNLAFKVKLAGVSGAEAKGATITVKLKLKDGRVLPLDKPLLLESVGNGVYTATATLTNPLPAGTALRVLVKGEKHSQVVFCRQAGQTEPCNDTEYITPVSYTFDFTSRPLPPGDLNQDGRVNTGDITLITELFKKPSSQQTAQDLKTADVNYSGKVDSLDLSLIFQTLETRYDEQ